MRIPLIILVWLPLCQGLSQTYLGDYSGYSIAGKVITVTAGQSSARFIFYAPDIVRVDFLPLLGTVPDSSFVVVRDTTDALSPSVEENDSTLTLSSSAVSVVCTKYPLRFSYRSGSGALLLEEPVSGGLAQMDSARIANFVLDPSEHIYGTGERGIGLDLRGETFSSFNTQVYGYSYPLSTMNINIPFLASTKGYALYFDNTYPGMFDLGASSTDRFSYEASAGELTFYVIAGARVENQLERYTWLTGRQPLPPRWAFGYLQSKFGYRNETEARTMVQTMRYEQIPCDAIILDIYWFNRMGDVSWYSANFPDPFQMMSDFQAAGFKTIVITEPYIIDASANWTEASTGGFLTTDSAGGSYLMPHWWSCDCPASLIDMTRPSARSWWWSKHPPFFGSELAGIWTDLGEPERHPDDMNHFLGSTAKVHNIYNLLWAQSVFEGFNQFRPNRRLFNLTRSGFAGIQRYGVIPWSGDVGKSFGGLAVQLPMLLNMGMSGLAYHNSDIGGFCCGFTTPELYVRWMQYGSFCPITRAHGTGPAIGGQNTEPWAFGPTAESIARKYLQLRYQLLPYIYTMAYENHTTGMPLSRPLFFRYPDASAFSESSSYLWGDAFLVSPVVQEGQTSKTIELPQGMWFDFWNDIQYAGGASITYGTPLDIMPLFVKAGSIVPMQAVMNFSNERPLDTLFLHTYPSSGEATRFTLYEDDGYTLAYQSGQYARTLIEQSRSGSDTSASMTVQIGSTVGSYEGKPAQRVYLTDIHGVAAGPTSVLRNGMPIPERFSYDELRQNGDGYYYADSIHQLFIHTPAFADSSDRLVAENLVLVSVHEQATIPREFRLGQNYPNPFNGSTRIQFMIAERRMITLKVYDVLGREVATLASGVKDPGTYTIEWDGSKHASGVYLYRLQAGDHLANRKMLLLK